MKWFILLFLYASLLGGNNEGGCGVAADYILGDLWIQDGLLMLYEVANGVVNSLVGDPYPIEYWANQIPLRWMSASQYYYSLSMVVLNPEVSDLPTLSIPFQGRIPATWQSFTGFFHCKDAGLVNIIFSIRIWNGPTQYSILLPFQKICASPCTGCNGHNSVSPYDNMQGCQCTPGYQTPCCDVGLWADNDTVSEVCQGDQVVLTWDVVNSQPSDRLWLFPPIPDVNIPTAVNFSVVSNGTTTASIVSNITTTTKQNWTASRVQRIYDNNQGIQFLFDIPASEGSYVRGDVGGPVQGTLPYALWGLPPGDYNVAFVDTNVASGAQIDAVVTIRLLPTSDPRCLAKLSALPPVCVNGRWNTSTKACDCLPGYFGMLCDHGCSNTVLTAQYATGLTTDSAGGELVYINNMKCSWQIIPAYQNTSAIVLAFHQFGTQPNKDIVTVYSGLAPSPNNPVCADSSFYPGTYVPATNCTRIYGVLSGLSRPASIVVPGNNVTVLFSSDSSVGSWSQGLGYIGFEMSYHAITCLQPQPSPDAFDVTPPPPLGVDIGTCFQCDPDGLQNIIDGNLNPTPSYFGCTHCDQDTFLIPASDSSLFTVCGGCEPPSRSPPQPDFINFCDPFWPPPGVDLSAGAFGVLIASGSLIMLAVLFALILVLCLYTRSTRTLKSLSPFAGTDQSNSLAATNNNNSNRVNINSGDVSNTAAKPSISFQPSLSAAKPRSLRVNTAAESSSMDLLRAPSSPSNFVSTAGINTELAVSAAGVQAPVSRILFKADMFPYHVLLGFYLFGSLMVCMSAIIAAFPQTDQTCTAEVTLLIFGAQLMVTSVTAQTYKLKELWAVSSQRFPQHMPYDYYLRFRNRALVFGGLAMLLDALLLIIGFAEAPLHIESTYRRSCTFQTPLIVCLSISVACKFLVCFNLMRQWWLLKKISNAINTARYVGWVFGNSIIVVILAFALIFGGGDTLADGGGATAVRIAVQLYAVAVPLYLFYYIRFLEMRGDGLNAAKGHLLCADEVIATIKENAFAAAQSTHTSSFAGAQQDRVVSDTLISDGADPLLVLEEELKKLEARIAEKSKLLENQSDVLYDIFERIKQLKVQQYFFTHQKRNSTRDATNYRSMLVAASERIMFRDWNKTKRRLHNEAGNGQGSKGSAADSKMSIIDAEGGTSGGGGGGGGLVGGDKPSADRVVSYSSNENSVTQPPTTHTATNSGGTNANANTYKAAPVETNLSYTPSTVHKQSPLSAAVASPPQKGSGGLFGRWGGGNKDNNSVADNDVSRSEIVIHKPQPQPVQLQSTAVPPQPQRSPSGNGNTSSSSPTRKPALPARAGSTSGSSNPGLPRAGSTSGSSSPGLPRAGSSSSPSPGLPRAGTSSPTTSAPPGSPGLTRVPSGQAPKPALPARTNSSDGTKNTGGSSMGGVVKITASSSIKSRAI